MGLNMVDELVVGRIVHTGVNAQCRPAIVVRLLGRGRERAGLPGDGPNAAGATAAEAASGMNGGLTEWAP